MPLIKIKELPFKYLEHIGAQELYLDTVSDFRNPKERSLSFIADKKYLPLITHFKNALLLIDSKLKDSLERRTIPSDCIVLVLDNAYNSFIDLINKYFKDLAKRTFREAKGSTTIDETAQLDNNVALGNGVVIGKNVRIYPNVVIMDDVSIGDNTIIYSGVVIYNRVKIGANVIIHANTVIGADGFGFLVNVSPPQKVPHIGAVLIEDNVEIGANSCVDRGTISDTVIESGTKIDNFVQVAHNCRIGKNSVLSAMTGLSGSTELGEAVIMGANSGTKGHLKIGSNTFVTARTSISKDVPPNSTVKGYPARNLQEALKIQTLIAKLPDIYKRLLAVEKKLNTGGKDAK